MRWQLTLLVFSVTTAVGAWSRPLVAQSAAERASDVAVVFEPTALDLPQAAIRDAIARELGESPDRTVLAAPRELSIGADAGELVVRFTSPSDQAERRVPRPADASQIPEILRLVAGNLARDQRPLVAPAPPPAHETRAPAVPAAAATQPSQVQNEAPPYRRHWLGLHVAQDLLWHPNAVVCDPSPNTTFSCFAAGTNVPYRPNPNSSPRSITNGLSVATTRLLASYDYAFTPAFSAGGRVGVAFRGGPNSEATGAFDPLVSESAANLGSKPFFPFHLEARATWWFAPLTNDRVRGFAGLGAGVMQVDAKVNYVVTCGLDSGDTSDGCGAPRVALDAWQRVGIGFVDVRFGTEIRLWNELGLELDATAVTTFPAGGFALEPSLGLVYGL